MCYEEESILKKKKSKVTLSMILMYKILKKLKLSRVVQATTLDLLLHIYLKNWQIFQLKYISVPNLNIKNNLFLQKLSIFLFHNQVKQQTV